MFNTLGVEVAVLSRPTPLHPCIFTKILSVTVDKGLITSTCSNFAVEHEQFVIVKGEDRVMDEGSFIGIQRSMELKISSRGKGGLWINDWFSIKHQSFDMAPYSGCALIQVSLRSGH